MRMLKLNPKINATKNRIIESLGLLPLWVTAYNVLSEGKDRKVDLVKYMEDQYGFGKLYRFGSKLKDGMLISEYEEDEDMEWLASHDTPVGLVWYFPYAIIALPRVEENDYFITSMD